LKSSRHLLKNLKFPEVRECHNFRGTKWKQCRCLYTQLWRDLKHV
jgi:hypothetical protein